MPLNYGDDGIEWRPWLPDSGVELLADPPLTSFERFDIWGSPFPVIDIS